MIIEENKLEGNIVKWFNEQPAWMRAAVEIYVKNGEISDDKIKQLVDICLAEARGEDCGQYIVSDTNLLSYGEGGAFAIVNLSNIQGVNAIDTDKPLNFAKKGLNVVFGANGAGKSGYIRIFKMISGATYREEIKPNIYQKTRVTPECFISIEEEGKTVQTLKCNLKKAGEFEVLKKIDIFDTKAALGYVNEEKEASFEPWIFGLFSSLGEIAAKVSAELSDRKSRIVLEEYEIPENIKDDSKIIELYNLTFETEEKDVLKEYSEKEERYLLELKEKSQIEKNQLEIQLLDEQIKMIKEILEYFLSFRSFYSDENINKLNNMGDEWVKYAEAEKLSNSLLFQNIDEIDKRKMKESSWKELWKFAREIFELGKEDSEIDYVQTGGVCPLCHRPITDRETLRMKTIDEYVNGKVAFAESMAKKAYLDLLKHPTVYETEYLLKRTAMFDEHFQNLVESANNTLQSNKLSIESIADQPIYIEVVELSGIVEEIEKQLAVLENKREELIKLNDEEEQKHLIEEIKKYEVIKAINANGKKIKGNISKLVELNVYENALKKTTTNKLTTKSKELAKELITDAYIKRFNDELKKLSASGLTAQVVQGKGRKGKIPYKVQLCDADGIMVSPKDILSEGESRAVALAAFFAEASGRTENCPLVVDDPISSLDYEYEERVISRLCEAAENRQVIIFTHRISLVVGLSEKITDRSLFNELSIRATKNRKGIPSEPDVNASKTDKVLNRLISDNISKLKKMDETSEEAKKEKHYICQQFRNCVEKSVEEYLIGAVVMRFRRDVQTKRIKYLPSITQEDCDIVDAMMTKYSAYDHSMSYETPLLEFDIAEIELDMKSFLEWVVKRKAFVNNN